MLLKLGQNFTGIIATADPDTGAGADPTVITAALYRNGVLDAEVVVTATDEAATAGITKLTGAIPAGYAEGDVVTLVATATVGGVSSSWPVWHASVVARLPGDLLAAAGYTAPDNAGIAAIAGYLDTEVAAIKAKTDLIPADPAAVGSAMTLTAAYDAAKTAATQSSINSLFTTALVESYAADGSAPTPAQALFMILQLLAEKSVSGTTMTVRKIDGVATAMTFTLDSATAPTSITRTT